MICETISELETQSGLLIILIFVTCSLKDDFCCYILFSVNTHPTKTTTKHFKTINIVEGECKLTEIRYRDFLHICTQSTEVKFSNAEVSMFEEVKYFLSKYCFISLCWAISNTWKMLSYSVIVWIQKRRRACK